MKNYTARKKDLNRDEDAEKPRAGLCEVVKEGELPASERAGGKKEVNVTYRNYKEYKWDKNFLVFEKKM